jgi:hypothetical protein
MLKCIDEILSTKHIFSVVYTLWPSFHLIPHFNSFFQKEVIITNYETESHPFFSNTEKPKKSKSSFQNQQHFSSSTFQMERNFGSECNFVLNGTKVSTKEMFSSEESENESFMTEMDELRQVLKLSGGSRNKLTEVIEIEDSVEVIRKEDFNCYGFLKRVIFSSLNKLRKIHGFIECRSLYRIEVPLSVEKIGPYGFSKCSSLNEIVFSSDSHLREISGFVGCTSLCRIDIPSSVEIISAPGFDGCTSLNVIIFSSDSHLREISGFGGCTSLCRIEIPSSVEKIGRDGFSGCTSLRVVIIRAGCRMRKNERLQRIHPFVHYENENEDEYVR